MSIITRMETVKAERESAEHRGDWEKHAELFGEMSVLLTRVNRMEEVA